MHIRRLGLRLYTAVAVLLGGCAFGCAGDLASDDNRGNRTSATDSPIEWRAINGNESSTRYSPLSQINASNFEQLKVAWEWREKAKTCDR
jgi:glucose dehydrogenase